MPRANLTTADIRRILRDGQPRTVDEIILAHFGHPLDPPGWFRAAGTIATAAHHYDKVQGEMVDNCGWKCRYNGQRWEYAACERRPAAGVDEAQQMK